MANELFIWSNIPGQMFKFSLEGEAASRSKNEAKAGNRVQVEEVTSVDGLVALFVRLAKQSDVWSVVSFYTHGYGGSIALGSDNLWYQSLSRFQNQNIEGIFAKDCVISFEGCHVADHAVGEFFLTQVAATFLKAQGGKVRGNTGGGFGYWGGDSSVHPFGTWVTANMGPGGTLRLENFTHLHPTRIQERTAALEKAISEYRDISGRQDKQYLQDLLQSIKNWGTQGINARYQSCELLDKAEKTLEMLNMMRAFSFAG